MKRVFSVMLALLLMLSATVPAFAEVTEIAPSEEQPVTADEKTEEPGVVPEVTPEADVTEDTKATEENAAEDADKAVETEAIPAAGEEETAPEEAAPADDTQVEEDEPTVSLMSSEDDVVLCALTPEEPILESEQKELKTVELKYLDPSTFAVNDTKRLFAGNEQIKGTATLNENGMLTVIPEAPKTVPGWEFAGWYTAPVEYTFWGDKIDTGIDFEPYPAGFATDCDGNAYKYEVDTQKEPEATHKLQFYWRWLSTLSNKEGTKVDTNTVLESGSAIYALYKPTRVTYEMNYNGWPGRTGVLSCTREYGTPFGGNDAPVVDGYTFEGWYTQDGQGPLEFYSVPQAVTYYAHWHSTDDRVNQDNYKKVGYKKVTSLYLRDNSNGSRDLGEILNLHTGSAKTIYVDINPSDSGVTELTWESSDKSVATIEVLDGGTRATIYATDKAGTSTITVKSENGCMDSVVVDTTGHNFDKIETVQQGYLCIRPTIYLDTCVICGKTRQREIYASHNYAIRYKAATCVTPKLEEHYCKVCGYVDTTRNRFIGEALGHSFRISQTVGCSGTTTTKECQTCGYIEVSSDPSATSHIWASEATVDKRATCHSEGSKSIKCTLCGVVKEGSSESIPADPTLHKWLDWVVETDATETNAGQQSRKCSDPECGQIEIRAIPPEGHTVDTSKVTSEMTTDKAEQVADQEQADDTIKNTVDKLLSGDSSGNDSMLAEDVLHAVTQEREISTKVQVTPVVAPETKEDAEKFSAIIGENATVLYMDIDIFVVADGENIGRITETEDVMTFNVALPSGGRIVRVLRAHEGEVEVIPSWVKDGVVYFTTDKFSTFAVSVSNDISQAQVETVADQTYTGSAIQPTIKVTINDGEMLEEGKDYTLTYKNNTEVGNATIVVTGIGDFEGTVMEVPFRIIKTAEPSQEKPEETESPTTTETETTTEAETIIDTTTETTITTTTTIVTHSNTSDSPKTGDETSVLLWVMLLMATGCGLIVLMRMNRAEE